MRRMLSASDRQSLVAMAVSILLVGAVAAVSARFADAPPATASVAALSGSDRSRLGALLNTMGMAYGEEMDDADVARAADRLGVGLGASVDTADIDRLVRLQLASDPMASVGEVELTVPSTSVRLIGFHQAAHDRVLGLTPAQRPGMTTLPTRRRGTPSRSAVDVAVAPDTPVYAPVTGKVVEAAPYRLYRRHADTRVRVVPDADPSLLVTVLHVTGPLVSPGDHVEAGAPLAQRATQLPFVSQIDRHAGPGPHLHLEVRERDAN